MRFIVLVKGNEQSEGGQMPDKSELEQMETFNEQLEREGILRAAEGLQPTSAGARIDFGTNGPAVKHGPFEVRGGVAGFWIIETASLQAAIDAMKRAPFKQGQIELRPLAEAEDFAFAPEVVKREKALRAKLDRRPS